MVTSVSVISAVVMSSRATPIGLRNLRGVTGDGDPRADRPEVPQLFAGVLHGHAAATGPQDERVADASRLSRFPRHTASGVLE